MRAGNARKAQRVTRVTMRQIAGSGSVSGTWSWSRRYSAMSEERSR